MYCIIYRIIYTKHTKSCSFLNIHYCWKSCSMTIVWIFVSWSELPEEQWKSLRNVITTVSFAIRKDPQNIISVCINYVYGGKTEKSKETNKYGTTIQSLDHGWHINALIPFVWYSYNWYIFEISNLHGKIAIKWQDLLLHHCDVKLSSINNKDTAMSIRLFNGH